VNGLDLLRRWGTELDPPGTMPPPALRVRILNRQPTRPPRRPAAAPRMAWSLALSAGLAVAVTGGVFWAQDPHSVQAPDPGSASVPATVNGMQILHNAAVVVGQQPVAAPRPDQVLFTEEVSIGIARIVGSDGTVTTKPGTPQLRQVWNSVDGTRDGLIRGRPVTGAGLSFTDAVPACRGGRMPVVGADGKIIPGRFEPMRCQALPAFLPGLPTDAEAMLNWLYTNGGSGKLSGPDRSVAAFNAAFGLIERYYLTPATKAALFEALSRLPGVTVQTDVVDLAGRHGVAVRVAPSPSSPAGASPGAQVKAGQLIFDPASYAFLGTTSLAILRQAVVDNPGQQPS
jgi:hypothetical protein